MWGRHEVEVRIEDAKSRDSISNFSGLGLNRPRATCPETNGLPVLRTVEFRCRSPWRLAQRARRGGAFWSLP